MIAKKKPGPKPKKLAKSQRQRFIDFAEEVGATDPDALERAIGKIAKAPKPKKG